MKDHTNENGPLGADTSGDPVDASKAETRDFGHSGHDTLPRGGRVATEGAPDPFSPENMRLSSTSALGVEEVFTGVECRKPKSQEWFRVHPEWSVRDVPMLFDEADMGEAYYLAPELATGELALDVKPCTIYTAVNLDGQVFVWTIKQPQQDRKPPKWYTIPVEAAKLAVDRWVSLKWDPKLGQHRIMRSKCDNLAEPVWPTELQSFRDALASAFGNAYITDLDHPVVKRILGT